MKSFILVTACAMLSLASSVASADGTLSCSINKSLKPCGTSTLTLPGSAYWSGTSTSTLNTTYCKNVGVMVNTGANPGETSVTLGYLEGPDKFSTNKFSTMTFRGELPKSFSLSYGSTEKEGLLGTGSSIGVFIQADCTQE